MPAPDPRRPLRLLVIPDKYLPDQCGGGAIYTDMCRGLVRRGFEVTVRCPYPFYPEWTDKSGRNGWRIERFTDQGVRVERFGMFIPRNPRSVCQRLLLDLTFFASLCRSLPGGGRFDAVIAFCPHAGGIAFSALHKLIFGGPLWLSIMDLPADAVTATGMLRGDRLSRLLHRVQRGLFNRADVWRSISPVMVERLEGLRDRDQPILLIPDWLHPSIGDELRDLPSKQGRPPGQPVRLFYSGNIGSKQGLLDFCKILGESSADFRFRIHGEGGGAAQVRDWVAARGDRRFWFGPLVDESSFAAAMHEADLFVITERPENRAAFFPSKTIPAMASGTPILAISSPGSPLGREVRTEGLGPWFAWDDCGAVGGFLSALGSQAGRYARWQQDAIRRGGFFERERCLDIIQRTLTDLVHDPSLSRTRASLDFDLRAGSPIPDAGAALPS